MSFNRSSGNRSDSGIVTGSLLGGSGFLDRSGRFHKTGLAQGSQKLG